MTDNEAARGDDCDELAEHDRLRCIWIGEDEARVNDEVSSQIGQLGDVYQRGAELCRVMVPDARDVTAAPRIQPLPLASLRECLTRIVRFQKDGRNGPRAVHPPDWCVRAIAARGTWPGVPVLRAIVEWPVLRPDGTVLQDPGFDPATGLLYLPTRAFPTVPQRPTMNEASAAQAELLDLVNDFPFAGNEHKAAWLAGLLTPFARYAFDGPAPLFLIDKNVRGAGGSLLCDVVSVIATGRMAPKTTQVTDEAEERKRITAIARAGDPFVLIDNISRPFGNGVIDAALTTTVWKERILSESNVPEYPLLTLWWGTGNNVQIRPHADTWRRILPIRLESPHQNPETRTDFKYPDLIAHVKAHRARYVTAALTLLRAYFVHGRGQNDLQISPWGSYSEWSAVVRKTVVWCGLADPYKAHEALTELADTTATGLDGLVQGWKELCELQQVPGCTAREAISWLTEDLEYKARSPGHVLRFETLVEALQQLCHTNGRQLPDARSLGYTLRAYRGRVVDGWRLEQMKQTEGLRFWAVTKKPEAHE